MDRAALLLALSDPGTNMVLYICHYLLKIVSFLFNPVGGSPSAPPPTGCSLIFLSLCLSAVSQVNPHPVYHPSLCYGPCEGYVIFRILFLLILFLSLSFLIQDFYCLCVII